MEIESETKQYSKINSGMLLIQRLDMLWKDAHRHSREGDYKSWNEDLDRVWCELGGDVDEDSGDEKKYNKFLNEYASIIIPGEKRGFNVVSKERRLAIVQQKMILIKKELFLRRLQNTQGKGTAYEDEEGFD